MLSEERIVTFTAYARLKNGENGENHGISAYSVRT